MLDEKPRKKRVYILYKNTGYGANTGEHVYGVYASREKASQAREEMRGYGFNNLHIDRHELGYNYTLDSYRRNASRK